ncbi:response regulator [Ascidiimonas sp. W6]|uniref:response regulator n=1 Tax=Ascidiimonas meishanensis TaxID=3128903 RepID=UPI0030EF58AD
MIKKVLLIEDDPVLRENTAELLELANYDVETAANGKTGLSRAIEILPDVIICDIMMPELDGYGVLQGLSRHEKAKFIPFIFLSAKTEHKDVRKGMDLGADDYLTKPFEEEELINAIESRIAKAAILEDHQRSVEVNQIHFNSHEDHLKSLNDLRTFFDKEGDFQEYEPGEEIYSETTNSNYLYLVEKGVVKNHRLDEHGKELITGLYNKGDFFGYTSFAYNSPNPEAATAMEFSGILKVSKDRIKSILEENHNVTLELINYITDTLSDAKDQLLQMAYSSVRKKTANTILKFVDKLKDRQQDGIRISRSDLAGVAGIATESLIRALSSLKKEGLIEIEGRTIKVLDEDGLTIVE